MNRIYVKYQKFNLPKRREVWNCSSIAGSTLANFCLFLYLTSAFVDRFLFNTASSASVYDHTKELLQEPKHKDL